MYVKTSHSHGCKKCCYYIDNGCGLSSGCRVHPEDSSLHVVGSFACDVDKTSYLIMSNILQYNICEHSSMLFTMISNQIDLLAK